MADILAILSGMSIERLEAMSLGDLARWHDRAAERAPKQGKE